MTLQRGCTDVLSYEAGRFSILFLTQFSKLFHVCVFRIMVMNTVSKGPFVRDDGSLSLHLSASKLRNK